MYYEYLIYQPGLDKDYRAIVSNNNCLSFKQGNYH